VRMPGGRGIHEPMIASAVQATSSDRPALQAAARR
jgi:hypothetical protein